MDVSIPFAVHTNDFSIYYGFLHLLLFVLRGGPLGAWGPRPGPLGPMHKDDPVTRVRLRLRVCVYIPVVRWVQTPSSTLRPIGRTPASPRISFLGRSSVVFPGAASHCQNRPSSACPSPLVTGLLPSTFRVYPVEIRHHRIFFGVHDTSPYYPCILTKHVYVYIETTT